MRRITMWLVSTVAVLVLLFSYRTSTNSGAPPSTSAAAGGAGGTTTSDGAPVTGGVTYTGTVAQTRWGPVQVTITVADGKITSVTVPVYPTGNGRDQEINARALPILRRETLSAQSAGIDGVSGATVTSDGYKESLQAALDAAHLS
jgi:uncharacterized protein with FMN-binding domain